MRGYDNRNHDAFREAERLCDRLGIKHASPLDVEDNVSGEWSHSGTPFTWEPGERDVFRRDLAMILDKATTGVLMLRGWESSEGALFERQLALMVGLQVFEVVYADDIGGHWDDMIGIEEQV